MNPNLVSRKAWLEARVSLLQQEKALLKQHDALARARRELPMVKVEKSYHFQTTAGEKSLADLFADCQQLVIYHFMFGPKWEQGCPSCSFWADNFNGVDTHLRARNTRLVAVSNASLETILAYKQRLQWNFEWVSAEGSNFSADYGVSFYNGDESETQLAYNYSGQYGNEELPGISIFYRLPDGSLAHSYSTYARGLESINAAYGCLDLTPLGRHEDELNYPMAWIKRRDEY